LIAAAAMAPLQVELDEDAAEDRQRGDRHRDPDEQRIDIDIDRRGEPVVAEMADHDAKPERHRQRHRRDQQRGAARLAFLEVCEFKLGADLEHQQGQAKLAEDGHRLRRLGPEQCERHVWSGPAEQRRPEQQPGNDLADRARLPQLARRDVEQPRRGNHHDQLEQDREDQAFGRMDRRGHAAARARLAHHRPKAAMTA
jgi:hypothetical protein